MWFGINDSSHDIHVFTIPKTEAEYMNLKQVEIRQEHLQPIEKAIPSLHMKIDNQELLGNICISAIWVNLIQSPFFFS